MINYIFYYFCSRSDAIFLTDQYDASMVILRRRFCWSHSDIFYAKYPKISSAKQEISEESVARLLSAEVNLGDKMFYDSLNKSWWRQKELKENGFWNEVVLNCIFTEANTLVVLCSNIMFNLLGQGYEKLQPYPKG